MTTIADICKREVIHAPRETTVQVAAKLMRLYHVGTLVVVDEINGSRLPTGMVTDRDIVIEVDAVDLDPKTITVGDIMAPELVTVREDEGLLQAVEIMQVPKNGSVFAVNFEGVKGFVSTGVAGGLEGCQ